MLGEDLGSELSIAISGDIDAGFTRLGFQPFVVMAITGIVYLFAPCVIVLISQMVRHLFLQHGLNGALQEKTEGAILGKDFFNAAALLCPAPILVNLFF